MPTSQHGVAFALLSAALCGAACDDTRPFEGPEKIRSLRIVAVAAEPPELTPGEETTLSALVADPESRPVTYRWAACLLEIPLVADPSSNGQEAARDCLDVMAAGAPAADAWSLGEEATARLRVPAHWLRTDVVRRAHALTDDIPDATVDLVAGLIGVPLVVSVEVAAPDGETARAFKRVTVSLSSTPNQNPPQPYYKLVTPDDLAISSFAGLMDSCLPDVPGVFPNGPRPQTIGVGRWELAGDFALGEESSYPVLTLSPEADQPFLVNRQLEELVEDVYIVAGELTQDGAFDRFVWTIDALPAGQTTPLWVVRRDGRGGTSWCSANVPIAR